MKNKNNSFLLILIGIAAFLFSAGAFAAGEGDLKALAAAPEAISDDPYSDTQWSFSNDGAFNFYSGEHHTLVKTTTNIDIDIPEAWNLIGSKGFGKREVVVALIDTGVDIEHPELKDAIWTNPGEIPGDGIDNDGNGYVDDVQGWDFYNGDNTVCHYSFDSVTNSYVANPNDCDDHGTHCAGIIAAKKDNKTGIAGVASPIDVKIMVLKIHGGSNRKGTVSSAVKAIKYADRMGADICNLSWGTYSYNESLYSAIKESHMLFVCAAGNDGTDNDSNPMYPASFKLPNLISVGYTDWDGRLAIRSNYGAESVDIAVPSVKVYSTIVGKYTYMDGSSMAAPHVTGLAALLYSYGRGISAPNIKEVILSSVKRLPLLSGTIHSGGIPCASLALSGADTILTDTAKPSLSADREFSDDKIILKLNAKDDKSGVQVIRYFFGTKSLKDFQHGTSGTVVEGGELAVSKAGYYTFYIRDYSGNELAKTVYVSDDVTAPSFANMGFSVSDDYETITVTGRVTDSQSGVKAVKLLPGKRTTSDFSSQGSRTKLDNKGWFSFSTEAPGQFTVYSVDFRGNKSIDYITTQIIQSTELTLARKTKTLAVGKTFKLKYTVFPETSTDKVRFSSSNKKVATVDSKGRITALKAGSAKITVRTSSGLKAVLKLRVK